MRSRRGHREASALASEDQLVTEPTFPLPPEYGREILRSEVGSTLHGTGLSGNEDRDEMGIYIEGPSSVIGLAERPHWQFRTAGGNNRSTKDDTDVICYSARRWAELALKANPSVLLLLYAPPAALVICDEFGEELRANAVWFASKRAGAAFLGYLEQQRQRMVGQRGKAGRVRLMPEGRIDWKYAMHMLRLGYQGVEYLSTGHLTLPVPGDLGDHLRSVRRGDMPFEDVIAEAERLEAMITVLLEGGSPLPDEPDRAAVEAWLIKVHLATWPRVKTLFS